MASLWLLFVVAASSVYGMVPDSVDAYLTELQARQADFGARVVEVARCSLGTPYVDGPLGEGPGAPYDSDPLIDLAHVDCVTFVEQTIALAASHTYKEAFDLLQKIRYAKGQIAFEHRNHFMIADWIANNTFCKPVASDLGVPTDTVTRTIGRKKFFEMKQAPELGAGIPDEAITLTYVPCAQAATAEKKLPSPALILFIGKVDWLFVVHCGLFIREPDGQGRLYHASSTEAKVVAIPFTEPFEKSTRYLGFTAYSIQDPTKPQQGSRCPASRCVVRPHPPTG